MESFYSLKILIKITASPRRTSSSLKSIDTGRLMNTLALFVITSYLSVASGHRFSQLSMAVESAL